MKGLETLERRQLLAAIWHNEFNPVDVNDDGFVTPLDPLTTINRINSVGAGELMEPRDSPPPPFYDVNRDGAISPIDVLININEINRGDLLALAEGGRYVTELIRPIKLGQDEGSRTLSFEVSGRFDTFDDQPVVEDMLLVYLVDKSDRSRTLLDGGRPGSPFFSLANTAAKYPPGLVRFDGKKVDVDLTSLGHLDEGRLLVQLVNHDTDTGTRVVVDQFVNITDPNGSARPTLNTNPAAVAPSTELEVESLSFSPLVEVKLEQTRVDGSSGRYTAEISLHNKGDGLGRELAVVFPGLPEQVSLAECLGFDCDGGALHQRQTSGASRRTDRGE